MPTRVPYTGPTGFATVIEEDTAVTHSKVDLRPYLDLINKTRQHGKSSSVVVPEDSEGFHTSNFRKAAEQLKVGLRVQVVSPKDPEGGGLAEGNIKIKVQSAARRSFTPEQLAERKRKMAATREANKAKKAAAARKATAQVR